MQVPVADPRLFPEERLARLAARLEALELATVNGKKGTFPESLDAVDRGARYLLVRRGPFVFRFVAGELVELHVLKPHSTPVWLGPGGKLNAWPNVHPGGFSLPVGAWAVPVTGRRGVWQVAAAEVLLELEAEVDELLAVRPAADEPELDVARLSISAWQRDRARANGL